MSYLARLITPRCIVRTAITMMATLGLLGAGSVLAQSTAGNALTGQGLFDANCKACHGQTHPAAGTLNVRLNDRATILNWTSFNIASGSRAEFRTSRADATAVLNRVTGG